jgi:hypothetical protein
VNTLPKLTWDQIIQIHPTDSEPSPLGVDGLRFPPEVRDRVRGRRVRVWDVLAMLIDMAERAQGQAASAREDRRSANDRHTTLIRRLRDHCGGTYQDDEDDLIDRVGRLRREHDDALAKLGEVLGPVATVDNGRRTTSWARVVGDESGEIGIIQEK